jgi:Bacteriophage tail sheath protein
MPQYMTPGAYVEEIPSASKPIEGVSTAVAAFVGLAPFGPMNTPVRLSNWGQFARTFGNPHDPKAGPFMKGAYLAHAVYGFFHNGGALCHVVRVGEGSAPGAPQKALPAATGDDLPFRVVARDEAGNGEITVEIQEEEQDGVPKTEKAGNGSAAAAAETTYRMVVTAEPDPDSKDPNAKQTNTIKGLRVQKGGSSYIVTKVNFESTLIMLEETEPDAITQRPPLKPGAYKLDEKGALGNDHSRPGAGRRRQPDRGRRPRRGGRDHDAVRPRPHEPCARGAADRPSGEDDRPLRADERPHGDPRRAA